jgi:NAD(P)-dependent dehydrogenase (short-subunit alcohol dehydrogenase family)
MRDLGGKTAFVTGGASGIGLALGRAFAEASMNVMLADIELDALTIAVDSLRGLGPSVRGTVCDVTNPASLEHAAETSYETFGNVHIVCNNAGSPPEAVSTISRSTPGVGCSMSILWGFCMGCGPSSHTSVLTARAAT